MEGVGAEDNGKHGVRSVTCRASGCFSPDEEDKRECKRNMLKNPASEWLSEKAWLEIQSLELLPSFKNFITDFTTYKNDFKRLFDSQAPHEERLIQQWENKLNHFQRLLVLKSLRPDKVMNALQNYIAHFMGQRFIEPQTSDVSEIFGDSSNTIPLIFILSPGTDPASELYKFATKMNFTTKLFVISLGQGQGPRAEAMMDESMDHGYWVFFQNCHLAPSWMPRLEYLIENIDVSKTHKDFRVWLTSSPSPDFPVPVLQNSSKMTIEPPRGIKANMIRSYTTEVTDMKEFFESEDIKLPAFKSLLFALCLFHGACIERRKFGPLGFNIAYEFTSGDLRICISQLKMFILEYDDVPFKVLSYTAGQINYGGRVTDDWDRRCIMNILSDYYDSKVMQPEYKFDKAGAYCQQPSDITLEGCLNYLKTLPLNDDPDIFGLHANADISCAQQETIKCLTTLLALQPRTVGGQSTSQEEITAERANDILNTTPKPLNVAEISEKYPVQYEESLNTVLVQEIIRYNPLLKLIHNSLTDLLKALKGLVVMSEALENLNASLFTNVVPQMWNNKAYPSLKPLGAWVLDLKERIDFINKWVDHGIPITFWISGFFFPQAFLTGNLQNYARKYVISIDTLAFGFRVHDGTPYKKPEDGCYVYGLFLEGARWDPVIKGLGESRPKELFTQFPIIWMVPEKNHVTPSSVYESPVYKTLTRAGTLSTTGHSTNYVVTMELPSREPQKHWIKRGVALICALDY
ncbi:Dynein heavy chain, cytoplasmic-like Protein [Gryllus bimaculatus]|nr:Dynein heavy chain, cytoplasmic-like Protein [Gryllus bimaculatus]